MREGDFDPDAARAGRLLLRLGLVIALADGLLGIPLAQKWVGPNGFYGLRTAATSQSPDVWYESDADLGWGLIGASLVALALYLVLKTGVWSPKPMAGGLALLGVEAALAGAVSLVVALL